MGSTANDTEMFRLSVTHPGTGDTLQFYIEITDFADRDGTNKDV